MFKKLAARLANAAMSKAKGTVTYVGIATFFAPILSQWLGFDIPSDTLVAILHGAGAAIAIFGKWRASRNYQ